MKTSNVVLYKTLRTMVLWIKSYACKGDILERMRSTSQVIVTFSMNNGTAITKLIHIIYPRWNSLKGFM